MQGLASEIKIVKVKDHSTAATSGVTSDGVDTLGFGGVLFLTSFGTAAADNTLKAQQSDDDGSTDAYSDLEGTSVVTGASPSNEDVWIEVVRPAKRYVNVVAARGTSSTLESIWAILFNPDQRPTLNVVSGTIIGESHVTPAEGTA